MHDTVSESVRQKKLPSLGVGRTSCRQVSNSDHALLAVSAVMKSSNLARCSIPLKLERVSKQGPTQNNVGGGFTDSRHFSAVFSFLHVLM